jgi:hypothetical protein
MGRRIEPAPASSSRRIPWRNQIGAPSFPPNAFARSRYRPGTPDRADRSMPSGGAAEDHLGASLFPNAAAVFCQGKALRAQGRQATELGDWCHRPAG